MSKLTWLITGCSSGFGREFVHQILARGDNVIATARSSSKILDLEAASAKVLELDVTSPQADINKVMEAAVALFGRVDVLVNNAGFVRGGSWEDLEYEDFLASFETNTLGPIKVTRALLPHFRQNKAGVMVFVSSLTGWIGHGFSGAYAASKFALEGACESLHKETSPLGLRTLVLEPGYFRTTLLSEGHLSSSPSKIKDYEQASTAFNGSLQGANLNQLGDPKKFVKLAIDLVRQEGVAAGRTVPFRLPVGKDCESEIREKLVDTTRVMDEWREVIESTAHDE